jgi:hypothetical protein
VTKGDAVHYAKRSRTEGPKGSYNDHENSKLALPHADNEDTVNSSFYSLIITGRGQHETRKEKYHGTSSHAKIVREK